MEAEKLREIQQLISGREALVLKHTVFFAVVLIAMPMLYILLRKLYNLFRGKHDDSSRSRLSLISFTLFSLGSVFLLRYSVGLYNCFIQAEDSLLWWEEISNSLIHALQTFSMDEDYTGYVTNGKEMIYVLSNSNISAVNLYSGFVLLMNIVAPIAGGAMLLDLLTSILPNLRLFFLYRCYFHNKYYFSKLNERSLALATSIMNAYRDGKKLFSLKISLRPIIIFCDVYTDRENEKDSELLLGAKALGAVCVKDDLVHIRKNRFKNRLFFLIDDNDNEINNLKMFAKLAEGKNARKLKYSEVFLFSQSDMHLTIERSVRSKLARDYGFKDSQMPVVTPVKCYRNLVCNLLNDLPLYEPLVEERRKSDKLKLKVSVLGGGVTGTEMLLSTYWFGQIAGCELSINVFSRESKAEFDEKLNCINPDIYSSTQPMNKILKVDKNGSCNPPYCTLEYTQCNVDSSSFLNSNGEGAAVMDSDYIFIALGTDEINITVANRLREVLGRRHLASDSSKRVIITYVVYDSALCDVLNKKTCFDYSLSDDIPDIYMRAVGSLNSVYSVRNVFLSDNEQRAYNMSRLYDVISDTKSRKKNYGKRIKDDYSRWSNLARAMHLNYKMFAMGLITTSVFETGDVTSPEYIKAMRESFERYKKLITDWNNSEEIQLLSWMEHRRWLAFMRTKGFRSPDGFEEYVRKNYKVSNNKDKVEHKHIPLKLHPCLVEMRKADTEVTKYFEDVLENTTPLPLNSTALKLMFEKLWVKRCAKGEKLEYNDVLDEISYSIGKLKYELLPPEDEIENKNVFRRFADKFHKKKHKDISPTFVTDYKQYDYPICDIEEM